jgi:integrase
MRGNGRIFARKNSAVLWCAYYLRGREFRESTGHSDPKKAEKFLQARRREVGADQLGVRPFVGPAAERVKISCDLDADQEVRAKCDCLCCALERDLKFRGKESQQNTSNLNRVRRDFGELRAIALTADDVDKYIEQRLAEGSAPASINRTTQLLGQAFHFGIQRKRLTSAPDIRHLSEKGNERQGFFGETEFRAVVDNLPAYMKDFVRFAYFTGMRRGELASLKWEDVDGDVLRLRAENAKNGEARAVPLEGELAELIERRREARRVKMEGRPLVLSAWIFHRDGEPIGDFRKVWRTACCMAGVGKLVCPTCEGPVDAEYNCANCSRTWAREELKYIGRLFHDFRRSAVRDMVRAGVPETVAMTISGHKTRSMFDRYNITNDRDQRDALRATQEYRQQQASALREKIAAMPQRSAGVN